MAEEGRTKETPEEEPKKEDVQMGARDDEQRENARRGFGGFRRDANQRVSRVVIFCTICYIFYFVDLVCCSGDASEFSGK